MKLRFNLTNCAAGLGILGSLYALAYYIAERDAKISQNAKDIANMKVGTNQPAPPAAPPPSPPIALSPRANDARALPPPQPANVGPGSRPAGDGLRVRIEACHKSANQLMCPAAITALQTDRNLSIGPSSRAIDPTGLEYRLTGSQGPNDNKLQVGGAERIYRVNATTIVRLHFHAQSAGKTDLLSQLHLDFGPIAGKPQFAVTIAGIPLLADPFLGK